MEQMKNNESQHDQSAHDHVTRRPVRFHVASVAIFFRARAAIFDCEKYREINMQDHSDQQKNADEPEKWAEVAQMLRIGVDPFRAEKNLQVAQQMADDE